MPTCWRLTKTRHLSSAWTGARRVGGRWNSPGIPVVYASEALSLALVEVLVHLPPGLLPSYSAIPARYEAGLTLTLSLEALADDWRSSPPPTSTQAVGDAWARERRSAILRVPSVVIPQEWNLVINPAHPDFPRLEIDAPLPFPFDPRLRPGS